MPTLTINESGCRSCNLCVEVCPTKVLAMESSGAAAKVVNQDDCIGCLSCKYVCPSRCLDVSDHVAQRPFYRIEDNERLIERFLQKKPASQVLGDADWTEALGDVRVRLKALADSVNETMGRGQKAVGRKSGQLAAKHMPEMYEGTTLEDVLSRMQKRFAGSFPFEAKVEGGGSQVAIAFSRCALAGVVEAGGEKIGQSLMCGLFHEYWAGLLGSFVNNSFTIEADPANTCALRLVARK